MGIDGGCGFSDGILSELGGVIHCFYGSREIAAQHLKPGYHIGIGGSVLQLEERAKDLRGVISHISLDRMRNILTVNFLFTINSQTDKMEAKRKEGIPRFSLFNRYILVADCNNHIERQIRRGNLHACVVVKGRYPETKCADTLFKVRKRESRCFMSIVEEAKSYSVRSKNFDYADFCENKIAQQECTPAVS